MLLPPLNLFDHIQNQDTVRLDWDRKHREIIQSCDPKKDDRWVVLLDLVPLNLASSSSTTSGKHLLILACKWWSPTNLLDCSACSNHTTQKGQENTRWLEGPTAFHEWAAAVRRLCLVFNDWMGGIRAGTGLQLD